MIFWDYWPWDKTSQVLSLERRIAQLEAECFTKDMQLENLALVCEHDRLLILHLTAIAKERARISGVPDHVIDNVAMTQEAPAPLAPPMRQTSMNGVHRS